MLWEKTWALLAKSPAPSQLIISHSHNLFIVCRHMQQPIILGMDFSSTNFISIIWTHKGMRKMIRSNGSTVIELLGTMVGIPLVLACSVKIQPGGNLEVPLDCTRKLTNQMDIRIDAGFHHKNPNVYIPPSCINNPNNQYNPKYVPLTLFDLSKVDHLYIGRDTVIASAEEPTVDTYNIELASEDKIKAHLAKPHNWVPHEQCLFSNYEQFFSLTSGVWKGACEFIYFGKHYEMVHKFFVRVLHSTGVLCSMTQT